MSAAKPPSSKPLAGIRVLTLEQFGAGPYGTMFMAELGAEVISVGVSPDGMNINEECGSTHPAAITAAVKQYRADIGISLDGDADRLVICDEKGQVVDGDQIMALIAASWAAKGALTGDGIVATGFGEQCDPPDGTTCDVNCQTIP